MNKYKRHLFGAIAVAAIAAYPAQAGPHHWGVGGRYHTDHSTFEELPFGSDDAGYGLVYEYHDVAAFWQIAVTYAPEVTGTNGVDSVITPQLNLILKDSWLRAGAGVLGSYMRWDEGGSDWTDLYWQLLLGIGIPVFSFNLNVNACYTFDRWSHLDAFDRDDIEYGAWLTLEF